MKLVKFFALIVSGMMSLSSVNADIVIDSATNDGSFNSTADTSGTAGSLGDNESSDFWALTNGNFASLNRSLGPAGNPDTQDGDGGSFVTNQANNIILASNVITLSEPLSAGSTFDYSVWGAGRDVGENVLVDIDLIFDAGSDLKILDNGVHTGGAGWTQLADTDIAIDASNIGATTVQFVWNGRFPLNAGTSQGYADNFSLDVNFNSVPEPTSLALLGLSGLGLAFRRRR